MTLKTILEKHGIKVRGLESEIIKWSYDDRQPTIKWYEDWIKEANAKMKVLANLNTELQAQHKADLEQIQKKDDQIKAAEVKLKFTEAQVIEFRNNWTNALSNMDDEQDLVQLLRHRINEQDMAIVKLQQKTS